jgi:hypothetical protein
LPGGKSEAFADLGNNRMLDGGGPGAHLVNGHALIRDRANEIEQAG